jgi:ubiquinone/menaquinone biosynthesis C-methylase UbiE|tara:strand:- start:560 stop:1456 length:897 start_codon:yes stop_codon:yes gene_type:complete
MKFVKDYKKDNGIYDFGVYGETPKLIDEFYDVSPFPNYNNYIDLSNFLEISEKNIFLSELKQYIGYNKKIIEVGSGTCQLGIFLAANTNNKVYCLDATKKSLELGYEFAKKNEVNNVKFIRSEIENIIFENNSFDFVICTGVLHHTSDPKGNFKRISNLAKEKGNIIVGFYNRIGRLRTFIRQFIFKYINKNIAIFLDPYLRKNNFSSDKKIAWIRDQYQHPLETCFTFDNILNWFSECNIKFLGSTPSMNLFNENEAKFYEKKYKTTFGERILKQFLMIFDNYGSEGGLFIMIGKRR